MFNYIIHPITNNKIKVNSKDGKELLKIYINNYNIKGGSFWMTLYFLKDIWLYFFCIMFMYELDNNIYNNDNTNTITNITFPAYIQTINEGINLAMGGSSFVLSYYQAWEVYEFFFNNNRNNIEYSNIILTFQMSWNLFITIIAYTRSWEAYFALFPSAWQTVYNIINE